MFHSRLLSASFFVLFSSFSSRHITKLYSTSVPFVLMILLVNQSKVIPLCSFLIHINLIWTVSICSPLKKLPRDFDFLADTTYSSKVLFKTFYVLPDSMKFFTVANCTKLSERSCCFHATDNNATDIIQHYVSIFLD